MTQTYRYVTYHYMTYRFGGLITTIGSWEVRTVKTGQPMDSLNTIPLDCLFTVTSLINHPL